MEKTPRPLFLQNARNIWNTLTCWKTFYLGG